MYPYSYLLHCYKTGATSLNSSVKTGRFLIFGMQHQEETKRKRLFETV